MMCLGAPKNKGFGLLDLMIAVIILSLLAAVAVPSYKQFLVRAKNARAIGDIGSISIEIDKFRLNRNGQLPGALAELPIDIPLDPWGNEFVYDSDGREFTLLSYGPDGEQGGEGDDADIIL